MPCILLFRVALIVLFYCRVMQSSLDPPSTHEEAAPSLTGASRDAASLIVTQCLGLPPLYSRPTMPLSVHFAGNLAYHAQKSSPFFLCSQSTRRPVLIALSCTLILLLLSSSGDVEGILGPVCPQALSFVDFCNCKCLGFMHINIRSLHQKPPAPHLSSELLLGDLNWDMRNTSDVLKSKIDALNLTNYQGTYQVQPQIHKHEHPHRYHPDQLALKIHLCCFQPRSQRSLPHCLHP